MCIIDGEIIFITIFSFNSNIYTTYISMRKTTHHFDILGDGITPIVMKYLMSTT